MKVLTSAQMKKIDRITIEKIGIPGPVLMENAGIRITQAVLKRFPRIKENRVVIVAGKGNNGGDGFVVARHLFNCGARPTVLLLGTKQDVKGDAGLNLAIAEKIGVEIRGIPSTKEWKKNKIELFHASLIIDAIFGTGLMKPAQGLFAAAIEDMNKARGYKIAVDIPSGLSSDMPLIVGPAVKADLTIALAAPKIGHVLPPAEDFVGELIVSDISVPPFLFEDARLKIELVEKKNVVPYFQKRKKDSHKGTYGHLLILAGSLGKTGAAVMAAKAGLRMGAGLVTVGTPQSCLPIVARSMMEIMTEALPETPQKTLSDAALPRILELLKGKDGLLLGPGISTHPATASLVMSLLAKLKVPVVIDADGLNILAGNTSILKTLSCPVVLTPHPGEFARLIGRSTKDVLDNRLDLAPQFAEKHGIHLILKGYRTLIATPQGRVFINPTGNPGMATGGSGDVLSGMLASLIIQEKDILGAILSAVFVHGLSGDIGAQKLGERALIAGDLIRYLPQALKEMEA
jgi:ADP-dependent NAD(P)H-hydrate dehydratase / NAD(P)H-hydrate epimerase